MAALLFTPCCQVTWQASRDSAASSHQFLLVRQLSQATLWKTNIPGLQFSFIQAVQDLVPHTRKRAGFHKGAVVRAMSEDPSSSQKSTEDKSKQPWLNPDSGELPPWARSEKAKSQDKPAEIPFPVYLIASALVAIATVGSVFEYSNGNPVFGVVYPDSPLWAPILGFFAVTGFPTAGYLFYKAITGANKASQQADEEDGYSD